MKSPQFHIRQMEDADLPAAMDIKNKEGWNQLLQDWEFLLHDKANHCLVAVHQSRVVATVTAITYDHRLAWIGMMLVRQEYRGLGLAKMLMHAILERLEDYPAIKLDATPAGFSLYEALGFVSEYSIWRMVRPTGSRSLTHHETSVPLEERSLQKINNLDQKIYGIDRKNLLRYLYEQPPGISRLLEGPPSAKGYIMGRPGTNYHQIGPLNAVSTDIAISLLSSALSRLDHQSIVVDVLADKGPLITWLQAQGFTPQRELIRMYYKYNPFPGIRSQQFLISGPELG